MRADWKPPRAFRNTISSLYGAEGRAWLAGLPALVGAYADAHGLTVGEPYPLSYNFVASADAADGTGYVIKAAPPGAETAAREAAVLAAWQGRGATRLHHHDPDARIMLLERAEPGYTAETLADSTWPPRAADPGIKPDDVAATRALAAAMRGLWQPAPEALAVPGTTDTVRIPEVIEYAEDFDWYADTHRTAGPLDPDLFAAARGLFRDLASAPHAGLLLHGDLHHGNLLHATRGGAPTWLAIDPKGLRGDPGFDTAVMLWNPGLLPCRSTGCGAAHLLDSRTGVLAEELDGAVPGADLGREMLTMWGFVVAVLSAVWDVQDDTLPESGKPEVMHVARMLYSSL